MSGNDTTDNKEERLPPLMDDPVGDPGEAEVSGEESGAELRSDSEWKPDLKPAYVVALEEAIGRLEGQNLELETRLSQVLVSYRKSEEETQRVRERLERERERRLALDKQRLFRKLLEPMDNLERSVTAAAMAGDGSPLALGVEMVWRQMLEGFQASGLTRFDPVGQAFDPELHEALGVLPAENAEQDGLVLQTELAGYVLDGELLRAARVLVGRKA